MLDTAKEELKKDINRDSINETIKENTLDSTNKSSKVASVDDKDFFVKEIETHSDESFSNTNSSLGSVKEVLNKDIKLDYIKEILNAEIPLDGVKDVLTKEIKLGNHIEMEAEIKKLKKLLATEVKLKEFLVQEIDIKKMLSPASKDVLSKEHLEGENASSEAEIEKPKAVKKVIKVPPYDHILIETLQKEQVGISFIYKELMKYAEKRNYSQVDIRLGQFSTILKQHYAFADRELYAYLKMYIALKYPKRAKAFNELSLEMKNISIEVFFSITQSPNVPLSDETYESFMSEFYLLGEQIKNRIQREEAVLFKMYEGSREVREIS